MLKAAQDSLFKFTRTYRLVSKQDFQSVFANPKKVTRKNLLILFTPNQLPHARLGIIIGKHLVKHATDRNRLRRVIRESFRHHKEALDGFDIIVLVRSMPNVKLAKTELRETIDHLWRDLLNKV